MIKGYSYRFILFDKQTYRSPKTEFMKNAMKVIKATDAMDQETMKTMKVSTNFLMRSQ